MENNSNFNINTKVSIIVPVYNVEKYLEDALSSLVNQTLKNIEKIIRQEMKKMGGQEIFLPALHVKKNWEMTGRWESLDVLFKLKAGERKEFALGPTHEEIITPLVKKYINSYRDLPVYLFQFQNKFRNEKRAKSGLIRGREFLMKDLYSFHKNEKDLNDYYEKAKKAYEKIFERCGLGERTYLTYASGGTFSKYSHEFQTITESGEDLIYICPNCKVAINKEILNAQNAQCLECGNTKLKKEKAAEVGNIFKLKDKFSRSFNLNYLNQKGEKKPVLMGCYGIGLQRMLGTIVEVCHDENGIIWPEQVAPYQIHLISLFGNENKKIKEYSRNLYQQLKNKKNKVLWDNREDVKAGVKFAEADLIGSPWRLVVSEKTFANEKVEIKNRNSDQSELLDKEEILNKF